MLLLRKVLIHKDGLVESSNWVEELGRGTGSRCWVVVVQGRGGAGSRYGVEVQVRVSQRGLATESRNGVSQRVLGNVSSAHSIVSEISAKCSTTLTHMQQL